MIVVRIDETYYLVGIEDCKTHLHGQIILSKGDKPLRHLGPWKTIPLGKGFYEFEFVSLKDMRWTIGWVP